MFSSSGIWYQKSGRTQFSKCHDQQKFHLQLLKTETTMFSSPTTSSLGHVLPTTRIPSSLVRFLHQQESRLHSVEFSHQQESRLHLFVFSINKNYVFIRSRSPTNKNHVFIQSRSPTNKNHDFFRSLLSTNKNHFSRSHLPTNNNHIFIRLRSPPTIITSPFGFILPPTIITSSLCRFLPQHESRLHSVAFSHQ